MLIQPTRGTEGNQCSIRLHQARSTFSGIEGLKSSVPWALSVNQKNKKNFTNVLGIQIHSVSISFVETVFSAGFLTRGVTDEIEAEKKNLSNFFLNNDIQKKEYSLIYLKVDFLCCVAFQFWLLSTWEQKGQFV